MVEKTIRSNTIFEGRILDLRVDQVRLSDGSMSTREIVDHAPAAVIAPFKSKDEIYLIRQFRKPIDQVLIEVPAGICEPGESPEETARRELKEETGFVSHRLISKGSFYPAPGFCNELLHFFLATDLVAGDTQFDEDESVELFSCSLDEMGRWIENGDICDLKTVYAFHLLRSVLA